MSAAGRGAPAEQLPAAQPVGGGLHEPGAAVVQGGDPAAFVRPQVEEVVRRVRDPARVAPVHPVDLREPDVGEVADVVAVEGVVGRGDHPHVGRLRHGDVRPPVDRGLPLRRVLHGDSDVQHRGAGRQPGVEAQRDPAQPLEGVHPQHRCAVRRGQPGRVQRFAGERPVPGGAQVPLHPAGQPGVAQREVGRLQDRVAVQQFATGGPVHQRPQPSAERGQEGRGQRLVLEHDGGQVALGARPVVVALPGVGKQRVRGAVRQVASHLLVEADARGGVRGQPAQDRQHAADRIGGAFDPQEFVAQRRAHLPIPTVMPWMMRVPSQENRASIGARMMQTPANMVP